MFEAIFFVFGLMIGSFLNVVVYRLKAGKSFIFGRSFCPKCRKTIAWYDNLPLLSYFWLKGKCRLCQKKISVEYPLVEFITGLIFLAVYWRFGLSLKLISSLAAVSFLLVIFIYDLKYFQIPDKISLPAIGICLALSLLADFGPVNYLLAGFLGAGFFAFQYFVSGGKWVGDGDIRLGALMGVILGWKYLLVALFIAYIFGAIYGLGALALAKKKLSSPVPFGPFLTFGTFLALLAGPEILNWYLNLLIG